MCYPSLTVLGAITEIAALTQGRKMVVLTGAGVSTDSGIPDYRGPSSRHRVRTPIQHHAFVTQASTRQRYWARSTIGWPKFCQAQPNITHRTLAQLEQASVVQGLITQNVDELHSRAGHQSVIELHGVLSKVRCLTCNALEDRESLQHRLLLLNPSWIEQSAELAPDGDADLPLSVVEQFRVATCLRCDGVLKPDVVFFGGNVPANLVTEAYRWVEQAEALMVLGSSLTVFSGLRFVRRAHERNIPVVIVNLGETRGDSFASLRCDAPVSEVLPLLAERLITAR